MGVLDKLIGFGAGAHAGMMNSARNDGLDLAANMCDERALELEGRERYRTAREMREMAAAIREHRR